jgi:FkbM family methyltransferase
MSALLDHLITALQAHRADDSPTAGAHYLAAADLAVNYRDLDVKIILAFCRRFLSNHYNENHVWDSNGEVHLLRRLAVHRPRVVFDVGAQHGFWTERACAALPDAAIHAFEIFPATAQTLTDRVGSLPQVTINRFGLLDRVGEVEVGYVGNADYNYLNSIVKHHAGLESSLSAPVVTGDKYMLERGVSKIDFLKIDAEGAEMPILRGFKAAFEAGAVDMVQFEYGSVNIHCHDLLRDFYEFLEGYGYSLGLIYPDSVHFKPYCYADENFISSNFLAVRRDRPDLLATAAG